LLSSSAALSAADPASFSEVQRHPLPEEEIVGLDVGESREESVDGEQLMIFPDHHEKRRSLFCAVYYQ